MSSTHNARSFRQTKSRGFSESYKSGSYGRYILEAVNLGTFGANVLLIDQPAGEYITGASDDLVLCSVTNQPVEAGIDFGAGRFGFRSAETPFFLAPPQSPSVFVVEHDHVARLLAIPMSEVRELLGRHGYRAHDELEALFSRGFQDPLLSGLIPQLWQTIRLDGSSSLLLQDSLLVTTILALHRASSSTRTERVRVSGGLSPTMMRKATTFLLDGLSQPLGLKALAAHCEISEFHLHRAFTKSMGCSPHRWQFLRRMELARELLCQGRLSVTEIALATGYESGQSFTRVFRGHYGCTPIEFRRANL